MPSFKKPDPVYVYDVGKEIEALRAYRDNNEMDSVSSRQIPSKHPNNIIIASWKISNLGVHKRRKEDYQLIAEIISWFDIVAIQGCNDDGLLEVLDCLPARWSSVSSVSPGFNGSLAFLFDSSRATPSGMIGELVIRDSEWRHIKLPGIERAFNGFGNPTFVAAFKSGISTFVVSTIDTFVGGMNSTAGREAQSQINLLEAYALARWGHLRSRRRTGKAKHVRPHVFISYSSKDRKYAKKLAAALGDKGIRSWHDEEGLRKSIDWERSITDELRRCDAVMVLVSKSSCRSNWVKKEIRMAKENKISVLGVWLDASLDGAEIDKSLTKQQRNPLASVDELTSTWLELSTPLTELRTIQKMIRKQSEHIIAIGQFNIPRSMLLDAPVVKAFVNRGLLLPPHSTHVPVNLGSIESLVYGQIFFPCGAARSKFIGRGGVFDFEGSVFTSAFNLLNQRYWRQCVKYYLSAHRPAWIE